MNRLWQTWALALIVAGLCGCANVERPASQGPWPDLALLVARTSPAVVGIAGRMPAGHDADAPITGSGFRVHGSPWVVTAAHVLAGLGASPVVVWQGRPWAILEHRIDAEADLALLRLDTDAPIPGLPLAAPGTAAAGDGVLVLGCPFGTLPTATVGIVSALPGAVLKPAALKTRLQLNAAINPGNSGGPVLDTRGRVIGVANATIPGGYGLGFAVPVDALHRLLAANPAH